MPFIKDDICYIPLQKSNKHRRWFALVDVDQYDRVSRSKWYGVHGGNTIYVRATSDRALPRHHMSLHSFIMRVLPGQIVDHINGNGLDNRKRNLRIVSAEENAQNRYKTSALHPTSRFKGVSQLKDGRWSSVITFCGEPQVIGVFTDEREAALAYDAAAVRLFGEFAKTNEAMGLFENELPVRSVDGQRLNPGRDHFGEYLHPEEVIAKAGPEGWSHEPSFDPDRRPAIEKPVALTKHRRTHKLMYRLDSGRVVHINDFLGTPPSPQELERMRDDMRERGKQKVLQKRTN